MSQKLLATLRGFVAVVLMLFATNFLPVAAAFAGQPVSAQENNTTYWESQGYGSCVKYDNLTSSSFTVPTAPTGKTYTLAVVKAGSDQSTDSANELHSNPVAGDVLTHSSGKTLSHVILCYESTPPTDVCANIDGIQTEVPDGKVLVDEDQCVTPPTDVCANIDGIQTEVPDGKVLVDEDQCVTPPTDVCANIDGIQTEVPDGKVLVDEDQCVTPPTDVCANIDGIQTEVPDGKVLVDEDQCVTPPTDVCKNIKGIQTEVPEGKVLVDGKCKNLKVFVCKYVGTPGVNERLKGGKNPISVSVNSTGGAAVGSFFQDKHGMSYVLGVDDGTNHFTVDNCPVMQTPTVPVVVVCGPNNDVYGTVPAGHYTVTRNADRSITLTATAGYVFANHQTTLTLSAPADANTTCGSVLDVSDVCPNITGDQATVPAGMTKDATTGNCITTVLTGGRGGDVLGASTAQLANTGESIWTNVLVGATVIAMTLGITVLSRRSVLES